MSAPLPDPSIDWPIPLEAVRLIAESEGLRLAAYKCPAGVWTCGWGETDGVGPKTRWTKEYADQRLCDSLGERAEAVRAMVTVETTDNQLGALVSLAYNIGNAALAKSSALKAHNRGDFSAAARAFALWNKATVDGELKVLPGLVTRRAREAALYLTPEDDAAAQPMPQAVAEEPRLVASPTASSSGIAAGVGALGLISEIGGNAVTIKQPLDDAKALAVETVGLPPSWWPWALLVLIGVLVLYRRIKQRREGVA